MYEVIYGTSENLKAVVQMKFKEPVCLFINNFRPQAIRKDMKNVLVVLEPFAIRESTGWMPNRQILAEASKFDYIITFDEQILNTCKNSVLFYYGHCSFEPPFKIPNEKVFGVSCLVGGKKETVGHQLRHKYYASQNKITIPHFFYNSSRVPYRNNNFRNPLIGNGPNDKLKLFNCQYHLAIENSIEKNYFTEKLIDCLIAKTIPIYYGCSRIEDFFNTDGMIRIDSDVEKGIDKINKLTEEYYADHKSVVDENFKLALKYVDFPIRLNSVIEHLINKGQQ